MPATGKPQPITEDRTVTAGEALARYATNRLAGCGEGETRGIAAALELVVQFLDQMGPELLDPLTRRRLERGSPRAARDLLGAGCLARLLGPCSRLFPFSVLAGHGVLLRLLRRGPAAGTVAGRGRAGHGDRPRPLPRPFPLRPGRAGSS